jgi:hypothetical protein
MQNNLSEVFLETLAPTSSSVVGSFNDSQLQEDPGIGYGAFIGGTKGGSNFGRDWAQRKGKGKIALDTWRKVLAILNFIGVIVWFFPAPL